MISGVGQVGVVCRKWLNGADCDPGHTQFGLWASADLRQPSILHTYLWQGRELTFQQDLQGGYRKEYLALGSINKILQLLNI